MTTTPNPPRDELPPLPGALASGLRGLRVDVAPERDLWPGIAAGLGPQAGEAGAGDPAFAGAAATGTAAGAARATSATGRRDWRRHFRRRNAGYATAAAVVLAAGIGWQLWPASTLPPGPRPASDSAVAATGPAGAADTPLLHAADALAREYQGALREVHSAHEAPADDDWAAGLDAQLERSATEVRAALARDPDALHLLHRLQRIYAHRLALSLRQA